MPSSSVTFEEQIDATATSALEHLHKTDMLCGKGDDVDHDQITFVAQAAPLPLSPFEEAEPPPPSMRPATATEKKRPKFSRTFSIGGWRPPRFDDDDDGDASMPPFVPISSTLPKPLPEAAPVRGDGKELEHKWHSFVSSLFHVRHTVFVDLMPQLCFATLVVLLSSTIETLRRRHMLDDDGDDDGTGGRRHRWLEESGGGGDDGADAGNDSEGTAGFLPSDAQKFHGIAGMVIGFLLALRTNLAYDRFYEGRKQIGNMLNALRETVSTVYT